MGVVMGVFNLRGRVIGVMGVCTGMRVMMGVFNLMGGVKG